MILNNTKIVKMNLFEFKKISKLSHFSSVIKDKVLKKMKGASFVNVCFLRTELKSIKKNEIYQSQKLVLNVRSIKFSEKKNSKEKGC